MLRASCPELAAALIVLCAAPGCEPDRGAQGRPSTAAQAATRTELLAARVREALSPEARAQLARAPVPVLLPAAPELAAAAQVTTGPHWYAASIPHGELTISIHATDVAHPPPGPLPPPPRPDRVRGAPATVTQNEGIQSAAWEEGGAAYALEVECYRPAEDTRCSSDRYVRELAETLVRVGAAP